jgi:type IV pilus assembly protein PilC
MSTYVFKAMDLAGVKARGEIDADSKEAVSNQLKSRGMIVLDIADKHASREIELSFLKTVKAGELAVFSRQLATMISSGLSILRALYVLEEQTDNKFLKETVVQVRKDVEAGLSLSGAMESHPKVFNPLFVAMTRAGEAGGLLESALMQVADQLEKEASLRRQIRSAMIYPALVITFAVGVMMALVAFLVPVFAGVFKQFGGELPAITQVSVTMSHAVVGYWWAMFAGAGLAAFSFIKWKKSKWGRPQWDRFRLRVPMKIGAIVQQVAVARWSRTLSSLMSAGVPLLLALEIVGKTGGNVAVEEAMDGVIASVKRGGTLAEPLSKTSIFPTMVTHMVGVGEETGALDAMLGKVADFYEDQVEASVKALTSILEPIMIIVIGSIVGFIVVSMYMPMFTVYNHIE